MFEHWNALVERMKEEKQRKETPQTEKGAADGNDRQNQAE